MAVIDIYNHLADVVKSMDSDLAKAHDGVQAAATRVRKQCQQVKQLAQELRLAVQAERSAKPKRASADITNSADAKAMEVLGNRSVADAIDARQTAEDPTE